MQLTIGTERPPPQYNQLTSANWRLRVAGDFKEEGKSMRVIMRPDACIRDTGTVKGRGVFALRSFTAGEIVEMCPVLILTVELTALAAELKTRVFDWSHLASAPPHKHALALGYGSMYNDANPANMRYQALLPDEYLLFVAARNIAIDEELTVNYSAVGGGYEWHNHSWFGRMNVPRIE
jgi:hypothetical protein